MTDQHQRPRRPDRRSSRRRRRRRTAGAADSPRPLAAGAAAARSPTVDRRRRARRPSRRRWAVALGAARARRRDHAPRLVFALVGRSPDATVLGYVPTGTVVYGEVRLDLPGDQRRAVGEFLSQFPGFADQAALDTKLDEVLDRLVADASNGKQTYTKDIKPWFDGELAFSVGPLPDAARSLDAAPAATASGHALALLSIKDATAAAGLVRRGVVKEAGATTTTETYDGATLTVFGEPRRRRRPPSPSSTARSRSPATSTSVKAADRHQGQQRLRRRTRTPRPRSTRSTATTSASSTSALRPLLDWSTELDRRSATARRAARRRPQRRDAPVRPGLDRLLAARRERRARHGGRPPPKPATTARADRRTARPTSPSTSRRRPSPSSVSHDTGKTLQQTLDLYKAEPSPQGRHRRRSTRASASSAAPTTRIGWIGDTALVVNRAGDAIEGGLVIVPTDAKAAPAALHRASRTSPRSAASAGRHRPATRTYDGTTITIVDLDRPRRRWPAAAGVRRCFALPIGNVEIACAVTDDVVVIGSGPGVRQARPRHDRRRRRSPRPTATRSLIDRVGHRHRLASSSTSPRSASLIERSWSSADAAGAQGATRPTSSRSSPRSTRWSRRARSTAT